MRQSARSGGGVQRWALRALIVSIVLSAASASAALLAPEFGETQQKVLTTTLIFTGASLGAMACATAWERRRRIAYAPLWGAALSYAAFALSSIAIWAEIDTVTYGKSVGTVVVLAVAAAHASLLQRTPLRGAATPLAWVAIALAAVLSAVLIALMWSEEFNDTTGRLVGILGVLLSAATIGVPVVHRMAAAAPAGAPGERAAYCPRCGGAIDAAAGVVACPRCGARFEVRFRSRV